VIVNLAVFFAVQVLWPGGFGERFEWPAGLIGAAAAIALFRFRVGVIRVVLASGIAGLVLRLAM
jgi:chromate transporter